MVGWEALATEKLECLSGGRALQFGHQPRFANAGFPGEQHNTSLPTRGLLDAFLQSSYFCCAPNEGRADSRLMEPNRHRRTSLVISRNGALRRVRYPLS